MSEEDTELEDFFEGETVEPEKEEADTTAEETETEVDAEAETEEEAESATAAEEESDGKSIPMAAYMEEKRKRQEYEKRMAELEALVPKQEEEAPDPYEDIDAYNEFMRKKWEKEQNDKMIQQRTQKIEEDRGIMLEQHDDFLQMEEIFQIMVAKDPSLRDKMIESGKEVEFAYNTAKEHHDKLFNPQSQAEVETEVETEAKPKAPKTPNLATINGGGNGVEVEAEDDLEDVFADQKY